MAAWVVEPCGGPLQPVCQVAGQVASTVGRGAADLVLGGLGTAFVSAAETVAETALTALDATTRVDLGAAWFQRNVAVLAAITLPVVVGLFALQVIGSVLRREPAGLVRAVTGVAKALLGSALAILLTQLALRVCDEVCAAIAGMAGTTVAGAARRFLQLSWLAGPQGGPVLQMLLATAVIIGSLLLWTVLLFRKAAILLVAVFAPVAFAGYGWDHTRVWARRWIEAVVALVFCKVVIVVVFVVGLSAFGGDTGTAGTADQPFAAALSDLLVGLLLLTIAVFSPWLTWRFVHWSGVETGTVLTSELAATPMPGLVRSTGSHARFAAQQIATGAVLGAVAGRMSTATGAARSATTAPRRTR
jgi:TrbL/VirB6 plasmid conjugal transfer protein